MKIYDKLIALLAKIANQKSIFVLTGIASTLWFLLRVIPKPQRATYPCMRAAAPLMSAFVCYILSFLGILGSLKLLKLNLKRAKYVPALACVGVFALALVVFNVQEARDSWSANYNNGKDYDDNARLNTAQLNALHGNAPIGVPQGIVPGRVVWVWDNDATEIEGNSVGSNLYEYKYWDLLRNDQYVIDRMFTAGVIAVAGEDGTVGDSKDIVKAWDKIFKHFNTIVRPRVNDNARVNQGYTAGEKVFIKINQTTIRVKNGDQQVMEDMGNNRSTRDGTYNIVESNPYTILALIRHLVEYVGVAQGDITVGDSHRGMHKFDRDYIKDFYPNVNTLPVGSLNSTGKTDITYSGQVNSGGSVTGDAIDVSHKAATYVFNVPALKGHGSAGYSATAKNFVGAIMRQHHYDQGLVLHPTFPDRNSTANQYRVLMDFMASKEMGQKTVLYIADNLYTGGNGWNGRNTVYNVAPFNGDVTSSLIMSLDQVALETVCFDWIYAHENNTFSRLVGVEDHLHQAADPSIRPSSGLNNGTYCPDGVEINYSLGVHENGSWAAGYANAGGKGIKLLRLKSSRITDNSYNWNNTDDLVNYPTNTTAIKVKQAVSNSYPADNEWNAIPWMRMDFRYLKDGGGKAADYPGFRNAEITGFTPKNYQGVYKYLWNQAKKEMYVLAKIKDNNFITAPDANPNMTNYYEKYDILELFFSPIRTDNGGLRRYNDAAVADREYAQHVTVNDDGNINHVIDVKSGGDNGTVIETLTGATSAEGNCIVKSGTVTKVGDYCYWKITLDFSDITSGTIPNEKEVKFSMAYNDIDYDNGSSGAVHRTGQYGTVWLDGSGTLRTDIFKNISAIGTVKLLTETVDIEPPAPPIPTCEGKTPDTGRTICATRSNGSISLILNNAEDSFELVKVTKKGGAATVHFQKDETHIEPTNITFNNSDLPVTVEICTQKYKLIKKFW